MTYCTFALTTLRQAQYILSQADVSEDQPEAAMARLGLVICNALE